MRVILQALQAAAVAAVVAGVSLAFGLAWALIVGGTLAALVLEAKS